MTKVFGIFIAMAMLSGCAAGVENLQQSSQSQKTVVSSSPVLINAVVISYTAEAQKEMTDNLKFNPNTLVDEIKNGLTARNIFDSTRKSGYVVDIQFTDIRIRSNFNAIMFGAMAGADKVDGIVSLQDPSGNIIRKFLVHTGYGLGGFAGGVDDSRMGWLYDKFAQYTVQELAGDNPK